MSGSAPCQTEKVTGMARSLLTEVSRMLAALAANGTTSSIDLRSLPLTDADREQLESALGCGEVVAELELAGRSTIWETRYPGAWWIRHRGAGDKVSSEEIAVCPVPEILVSHPDDVAAAAERLRAELERGRADSIAALAAAEENADAAEAAPTNTTEPEALHG